MRLQGRAPQHREKIVIDKPPPSRGPFHAKGIKAKLKRCQGLHFRGHAHRFVANAAYRRESEAVGYGMVWFYPDGELAEPNEPLITAEIEMDARILYGLAEPEHLAAINRREARRTGVRMM